MSRNDEPMRGETIRLTNQTARALRRCALRERNLCRAFARVLTLLLAGAAVALGVFWRLWAVPLVLMLAALLDALLLILGRSRYLMLIGQAICTEASARGIREKSDETRRRRQALSDLAGIREDMERMARQKPKHGEPDDREPDHEEDEDGEDDDLLPVRPVRKLPEARDERAQTGEGDTRRIEKQGAPKRRRRRQAAFQVIGGEQTDGDAIRRHPEARQ